MSGHSKWSTIKRDKQANDLVRGKVFSKLAKAISIAVKTGGGDSPEMNAKLRMAIDAARAENMPKVNIERAITKASSPGEELSEVVYEGFGPGGVAIIVETATDNRNRTAQEIKSIFERGGGSLSGPSSVAFNFEVKGAVWVKKIGDSQEQMLSLIDLGAEDIVDEGEVFTLYTRSDDTHTLKEKVETAGFEVDSIGIVQRPKTLVTVTDGKAAERVIKLLESLEDQEDVQNVFANVVLPSE